MSLQLVESPQALYHPLPHHSDSRTPSDDLATEQLVLHPPSPLVDARVRWIHFIMGCAVLLPWNVIITATPFFLSRLVGSPMKSTFASYLSSSFNAANFIFLAHATATTKHTSPSHQVRIAIIWLIVLTSLLTFSTFIVPSSGVFTFFVLFNGAAQAAAGAYLQTSVVAVASLFGPPAVQAMMSGQAAVAVAVSGVQVLSAAASVHGRPSTYVSDGSAEERSAFIFFLLSTIFLIFSAMVYSWLVRTPVYARVAAPLEQQSRKISNEVVNSSEQIGLVSSRPTGLSDENANAAIRVAKANVTYEVAVAYVFVVTLAVYPAITTSIQSTNPDIHPLLFSSTHFLVFNIGDFLGRYTCSYPIFLIWSAKHLLTLSVARTLFIPVFLMCNVQRPSIVPSSPVISSDFFYMAILFAFGWSNGYVSSLCMMSAPSLEHNPRLKGRVEDVDTAATVASFCLVGGLALGSIASFAVRAAICNCNPFTTS
ncbi:hypothetical protein K443DRAFT_128378 [Laccaria amethystina LaAM-08-1]|uniref:Nucleoside transporter n=1 Tax=Laccaria amethystina LaAM-08-1 TaxID=1095629 RepID=A0A0C9X8E3_9AGAR|nr:hypothetical protein K443DRAFT_128378 [Laccaria amethystina LaAM-08-1]